jgi:hypothetical protein
LTRIHPSPSFSSFARYLRNKPTNATSCAIAAESIDEIHRKRAQFLIVRWLMRIYV